MYQTGFTPDPNNQAPKGAKLLTQFHRLIAYPLECGKPKN